MSRPRKIADGIRREMQRRRAWKRDTGKPWSHDIVVAAADPNKSASVIARELGVRPAYVRHCFRRAGIRRPNRFAHEVHVTDEPLTRPFPKPIGVKNKLKWCNACNKPLSQDEFFRAKSGTAMGLLKSTCKSCEKSIKWEWRGRFPNRAKAETLLSNVRTRAVSKGIECELTLDWVHDKIDGGFCEATGLPFVVEHGTNGKRNIWAPSVDRIDPQVGYTLSNCRVVVWLYNAAKNDASDEDVVTLARAIVARSGR